jgi:hypothetical protein
MESTDFMGDVTFKTVASALATVSGTASAATSGLIADIFGIPLSVLLAGFAGSVVALSFLDKLPRNRSFIVVAAGTVVASYGVQFCTWYFKWPAEVMGPAAFFIGLGAHLCLTFVFKNGPTLVAKKYGGDT